MARVTARTASSVSVLSEFSLFNWLTQTINHFAISDTNNLYGCPYQSKLSRSVLTSTRLNARAASSCLIRFRILEWLSRGSTYEPHIGRNSLQWEGRVPARYEEVGIRTRGRVVRDSGGSGSDFDVRGRRGRARRRRRRAPTSYRAGNNRLGGHALRSTKEDQHHRCTEERGTLHKRGRDRRSHAGGEA